MLALWQLEFMRHAVLAGVLCAICFAVLGSLVVVNRLVFIVGGISHAAYGGIGLAFACGLGAGLGPLLGATVFTVLMALIMAALAMRHQQRLDTIIGVLWAFGMALGIVLIELQPGYSVNLLSYLFGSIVAVGVTDLWLMGSLTLFVLVAVSLLYRWLLAMSFDAEFASIRGLPTKTLYTGLLVLIAIAVVLFINVVGLLLVIALMTIAPYIAERWTRSLRAMMVLAALCNTAFVLSGLALSYQLKLSAGPAIILVATLAFFLSYAAEWLVTQRRQSASPLPHPKA
jgi:zinc transport system permease protein